MNEMENGLQAFELLMPLAEAGDAEAQCIIGNLYDLGLGRERDVVLAIDWYQKSMEGGYGVAANNLATIRSSGYDDVPGDKLAANELLKEARRLDFINGPLSY